MHFLPPTQRPPGPCGRGIRTAQLEKTTLSPSVKRENRWVLGSHACLLSCSELLGSVWDSCCRPLTEPMTAPTSAVGLSDQQDVWLRDLTLEQCQKLLGHKNNRCLRKAMMSKKEFFIFSLSSYTETIAWFCWLLL